MKLGHSSRRTRRSSGGRFPGSGIGKAAGSVRSRRNRRDRKSLGKGEPEIEGEGWDRKSGVNGRWIHSRAEGKIGDAGRAFADIVVNGAGDRGAEVITETKGLEMLNRKESGADGTAKGGGFKSSVVGATGNMRKSSNEFGGTIKGRVLNEQIGEEVEAAGLEVSGGMDSRGRRHKKFNGVRGAAKNKANEGGRR